MTSLNHHYRFLSLADFRSSLLGVADLRYESSRLGFLKPRPKLTFAREPAQLAFIS